MGVRFVQGRLRRAGAVDRDRTGTEAAAAPQRRLSPWWYLVYLGLLGFQPAFDPTFTTIDWVATGALAVLGGGLYVLGELRPPARVPVTIAFTVLAFAGVWLNSGVTVFYVYAAAYAGAFEPRRRAMRWLAALTAILVVSALTTPIPMPYRILPYIFPVIFIWIVGRQTMDDAERGREAARLRVDNIRIERLATLSERERIARDLHDLLGHSLTGVLVRAQLVRRLVAEDPTRAAAEAGAIEDIARDALSQVRSAVSGWRHHALDAELDAARGALTAAGVELSVRQPAAVSMSPQVEAALALAVREAVTNIVRHAAARRCTIAVVADGDEVRLTVGDDGVGMHGRTVEGSGLAGMRERIAALGGRVERSGDGPGPGRGTTVQVAVPAQGVSA